MCDFVKKHRDHIIILVLLLMVIVFAILSYYTIKDIELLRNDPCQLCRDLGYNCWRFLE